MPQTSLRRAIRQMPVLGSLVERRLAHKPVLTPEEVAHFHSEGFVVIDPGLDESVLDAAIAAVIDRAELKESLHHGSRVMNGWGESRAIKQIATAPRVLRILRQLYGREPLPFQTLNFPIGTEQKIHSDTLHFNCDPPTYMCGVWVALQDIDLDNGALIYYPGSHKLKQVTMEDVAEGPGPKHYAKYEEYMAAHVGASGIEPAYGVLRKGQALIWAANLAHGGSRHRDKSRTRHSQVTHYYFEGCQYYTPLDSYGGYRHLRMPKWIR